MKTRTSHVIPAIDVVLDISYACTTIITRSLDLVQLESKSDDCLVRIVSGNYRLLPYAIEFWIEHCSQYATSGGSLVLDAPIQTHLNRMYKKHKDYLAALGQATMQARGQDANHISQLDERLKLFSHTAVHELMVDVLSLRLRASQLDGDNSSGKFRSYYYRPGQSIS